MLSSQPFIYCHILAQVLPAITFFAMITRFCVRVWSSKLDWTCSALLQLVERSWLTLQWLTSYWSQGNYPGFSLAAKYSSESLTLTRWLGCCLALWIHFICHSWYLWKVIQALQYGLQFQHFGTLFGFCQLKRVDKFDQHCCFTINSSKEGKHCPYKTSILDISNKGIILGNPFL